MIFTEETTLEHLCINYVGNQTHQEALVTTDSEVFITDEMKADRKSTRLNSSHLKLSRMPSSA